jgi:hypothetical protein
MALLLSNSTFRRGAADYTTTAPALEVVGGRAALPLDGALGPA